MLKEIQLQNQNQNKNEKYLEESTQGIYLPDNHAKMIWQGNKKLLVDSCAYKDVVGKNFYVIGGNNCYGVVKVTQKKAITLKQFKELESYHKISELETKDWFKGKKILFAYSFESVDMFPEPRSVSANKEKKLFSNFVLFLSEEDFKENLFKYDPKDVPNSFLDNLFVSTVELLKQQKLGDKKFSFEELTCFYGLLEKEYDERQRIYPYQKILEDNRKIVEEKILDKKTFEFKKKLVACNSQKEKVELLYSNLDYLDKISLGLAIDFKLLEEQSFFTKTFLESIVVKDKQEALSQFFG